ncbi:hypothetical protein D9M68_635290 [compost metagenome]
MDGGRAHGIQGGGAAGEAGNHQVEALGQLGQAVVDQADLDRLGGFADGEAQAAALGDVVRARQRGAVLSGVVHRHHTGPGAVQADDEPGLAALLVDHEIADRHPRRGRGAVVVDDGGRGLGVTDERIDAWRR